MQPSGESGDSSSEEDDDSSVGSADAEELAYLRQVEKSIPNRRQPPPPTRQWRGGERASSRASSTGQISMRTAPTEFRSQSSRSVDLRSMSAASVRAKGSRVYDENFDDSVNPWVLHPSARQFNNIPNRSNSLQQDVYRSPMSTSSSVTATQYNNSMINERSSLLERPSDQHMLLGPATKRAIESIQHEIEALNERINGLRKEMVDRDNKRIIPVKKSTSSSIPEDGWKWVIKVNIDCACVCDCY